MKKAIALILALVMMFALAACGSTSNASSSSSDSSSSSGSSSSGAASAPAPAEVKSTELKLNTSVSAGSTWVDGANKFAELIAEKTDGRYTIKVFTDSQLAGGSQPDSITMHQSGDIDVSLMGGLVWSNADTRFCMPCMPWLFADWDEVNASLGGDGEGAKAIFDIVEACGAHGIGIGANGFRQLTCANKPLTTLDDLKGLKIRIPGNALYIDLWKMLGADPVGMNIAELYTALQQGAVDAQENPWDSTVTSAVAEVLKYGTQWNYSFEYIILSISDKVWNTLSDEDKAIFEECGAEAMAYQMGVAQNNDAKFKQTCIDDYHIEITELTEEQIQPFKDAVQPIYDQYRDTMGDLYDVFGVN